MKRLSVYIFSILLACLFSTNTFAKWGKGELKMSKRSLQNFLEYLYGGGSETMQISKNKRSYPLVFTISKDGKMTHYYYCPWATGCREDTLTQGKSVSRCEKRSNGSECFTFAIKKRIVWKNGGKKLKIKKSDLKSPYVLAKKIQEAGFYDGDISKLDGIDMKTGRTDKNISITGEDKTKVVDSQESTTDIVKELTKLKELLDSGAITNEEFDKAKEELFNK